MSPDQILRDCRQKMDKSVQYLENEMRGIRTGRATTALVDHVRVDYYGSMTELKSLAAINVPEPTQLTVKPFDPGAKQPIVKALETADLGFNPQVEGDTIRINVPSPSAERRKQLVNQVKKMGEESRVAVRNERRDALKQLDALSKEGALSEDEAKRLKDDVEERTKEHIKRIDELAEKKAKEIEQV